MRALLPPLASFLVLTACALPATHTTAPTNARQSVPPPPTVDSLRARIMTILAVHPGADVGIYYHELTRKDSLLYNADVPFHAASTMKVPVMIELFRRVDSRTVSLDQTVVVRNSFASLVDGSPYTLDRDGDSGVSLYARIDRTATLRELNELMIAHSSNFATNILLNVLDPKTVNATAHALGARNMNVLRGVEDGKAFDAGMNNTTTARDLAMLLTGIERGTAASRRSCAAMKAVLLRQVFNTEIPAGLPAGVQVAHKTGWITGTLHDAAIVYPKDRPPYVLVVLTRNISKEKDAQEMIAAISRQVYAFNASR
jgi:beta-lactamase class A